MPIQGQKKTTFIQGNFLTLFKFPTFSVQKKPHLSDSLSFVLLGFALSVTQRKSGALPGTSAAHRLQNARLLLSEVEASTTRETDFGEFRRRSHRHFCPLNMTGVTG